MRKPKYRQLFVAKTADRIIGPLFALLSQYRDQSNLFALPNRILAVELWNIGDLVLITPALQALRAAYPHAHISLLAAPHAQILLSHQRVVDEIIAFSAPWTANKRKYDFRRWNWKDLWTLVCQLRARCFDLALDFRGDFRDNLLMWLSGAKRRIGFDFTGGGKLLTDVVASHPDRHQADQALDVLASLGIPIEGFSTCLWVSPEEVIHFQKKMMERGIQFDGRPLIGIHPGAEWEGRRWENQKFARLAEAIVDEFDAQIMILGGPKDHALLEEVEKNIRVSHVTIQPCLRELIVVIKSCDLFIGNDSGPAHIATAVDTPTVVIYGPQKPEWFGPYGEKHLVAIADVPCRPCDQITCHRPETSCTKLVKVSMVLNLVRQQLKK
jgi:lipopolysaccharide heptosyltransferase II